MNLLRMISALVAPLALFSLSVLCTLSVHAGEKTEFYSGVRSLGMGGTGVAVANDETGIFYNPAALGKLRDPFITIVDPELHISSDTGSFVSGFDFDILSLEGVLTKISENPNRNFHLKAQLFPSIVVPNFAMGVLLKYEINGQFDSANNEVDLNYTNDLAAVLGYNLRLFDGRVKVGFSGRYINRTQITDNNPIAFGDISGSTLETVAQDGGAIAADVGIIMTAPWRWLPTIAATVHDVGNTKFSLGGGFASGTGTDPDTVKQSIDVAIALYPILGKKTRTTITVEMRDILSEDTDDEEDIMRLLHAGFEMNMYDIFFIRGGMNQRYWTAGLEFNMPQLQFQLASYGEEIGTATENLEDRRYVMKFAYRF